MALMLCACHARNPAFCPYGEDSSGECIGIDAIVPQCYGVAPFEVCVLPPLSGRSLMTIDTAVDCDDVVTVGNELCVVKGTDLAITGRVRIKGPRPAVLIASNELSINMNGVIDATGAGEPGPGADLVCGAATAGGNNGGGGGGGAGGSFASTGGFGGRGGGGAGVAGAPGTAVAPSALQGGCSGSDGGDGASGTHGARGFGGGGLYLLAGTTMTIKGVVNASGGGGNGGQLSKGGGGGGGSGGMIVIYAPTIAVNASTQIFANGGGGGGGASGSVNGGAGATPIMPLAAASGGTGGGNGTGGAGAYLSTDATAGTAAGDGAGGGGGGGGVIRVLAGSIGGAQVSPPPS